MSSLSQFLASTVSFKAIQAFGPGSNGYWRREMWLRAGSYSFTVKKTGKHKIYAWGAGGGGGYTYPGASAGMALDERDFVAGDVITITLGAGGAGAGTGVNGGDGGTTTITCAARGLNITLTGATGGRSSGTGMTAGTSSGANILNRSGAVPSAGTGSNSGGCSSGSPFGNGFGPTANNQFGGCGWGGRPSSTVAVGGASSHKPSTSAYGATGLTAKAGVPYNTTFPVDVDGTSAPWWDLVDFDGAGGGANGTSTNMSGGAGGTGAGGGGTNGTAGNGGDGGFGAGGGASASARGGNGGNGGGGGAGATGGNGGDAACILYWDEVA